MRQLGRPIGNKQGEGVADMDGTQTLDSNRFVDVWNKQATRSEYYLCGYGVENNETNVGRLAADLVDSGANDITGTFRWVVYEDSDRDYIKSVGPTYTVAELEDSASASLRDKVMNPVRDPGAREDQHIALQLKVGATNDGNTIDTSSGSAQIEYTRLRQR